MDNIFTQLGNDMTSLGTKLLPVSFVIYFFASWFAYKFKMRNSLKLSKAIWYICNGVMMISKDNTAETIAIMILFMEASDSIYDYLEYKNKDKEKKNTQS